MKKSAKKIGMQALAAGLLGLGVLGSPMTASVFAQEDVTTDVTTTVPREADDDDDDGDEGLWGLLGLLGLVGLCGLRRRDRIEDQTTPTEPHRP